jgi:hypothetical protein
MMMKSSTMKKTVLSLALVASMGTTASASADTINMSWNGLFTMLDPAGKPLGNTSNPYYSDPTWSFGLRTQITGTMSFDTVTGAGSGTVVPFDFFSGGPAAAVGITFQSIGDGSGGQGTLVLGNMLFNWNGNNGIPVSIVLDAAGMFGAMGAPGFGVGTVITGTGATPASNGVKGGSIPIGPAPVATTTWNTTLVGPACTGTSGASCMGRSPSGGLPLVADTIGGSPMIAGPFQGYNANFDITTITVTSIVPNAVPVPAAVWLLGSGLLGLVGVARRKKAA